MYFNQSIKEIYQATNSDEDGLKTQEVLKNREQFGSNTLAKQKSDSLGKIIFNNLIEPLTLTLLVVIIICAAIQEYKEVLIISIIIVVNIIIGTVQEYKSQKALDALEKMSSPKSTIIRNDKIIEINSSDLVVGDIILLESGNFIPADIRLIETVHLDIDESALTGESTTVRKTSAVIKKNKLALADRTNMAFSSTFITNGRAKGIVVSVGKGTEVGKIAKMLNDTPRKRTPLQNRLAYLSKIVSILAFIIATIIFVLNITISHNEIAASFINAITLAVAVIPESLPVIVSIILAISVSRMAKHNAIIKKLPAVESLGTVNIICTDKTGTLTLNKMTITKHFLGTNTIEYEKLKKNDRLIQAMALCNNSFIDEHGKPIGDPTELALTYLVKEHGINVLTYRKRYKRLEELPFDSRRKLMTTVHKINNQIVSYTKGAIDQILKHVNYIEENGEVRKITQEDKETILSQAMILSNDALRVLGYAYKINKPNSKKFEDDLIFIGATGMIDPEKESARRAIAEANKAGIKTIMITGDHPTTAFAIAKKLNLAEDMDQVITGLQLDELSDKQLNKVANNYSVYARVSPEHKVRIVKALQSQGNIVSMTGDGVNDAPSLQTAHIGVAMGVTGTDVAKQASSMILMDDNFATIINAIDEGRNIYQKIKTAVSFVLATNLGEVIAIFIAVIAAFGEPLGAIHVLWVNLIVESLIAIPIAMDINDPRLMDDKPRPKKEGIFKGIVFEIIIIALAVAAAVLGGFVATKNLNYDQKTAQTVAFFIMATAPMLYVLSLRNKHTLLVLSKPWQNHYLILAIIFGLVLNIALIYTPLNNYFNLSYLNTQTTLIAIAGILAPTLIIEIYKIFTIFIKQDRA